MTDRDAEAFLAGVVAGLAFIIGLVLGKALA